MNTGLKRGNRFVPAHSERTFAPRQGSAPCAMHWEDVRSPEHTGGNATCKSAGRITASGSMRRTIRRLFASASNGRSVASVRVARRNLGKDRGPCVEFTRRITICLGEDPVEIHGRSSGAYRRRCDRLFPGSARRCDRRCVSDRRLPGYPSPKRGALDSSSGFYFVSPADKFVPGHFEMGSDCNFGGSAIILSASMPRCKERINWVTR